MDPGGARWIRVQLLGPGQLMGWGELGEHSVDVRGPEPRRRFRNSGQAGMAAGAGPGRTGAVGSGAEGSDRPPGRAGR